jgi:hypothetical protein
MPAMGESRSNSPPGASIPAPAQLASRAASRRSKTVTRRPARASVHAHDRPIIPAPTTITVLFWQGYGSGKATNLIRLREIWQAWNCKPVSVPLRAIAIHPGHALLHGSSDLPGSITKRAASPPLFGLAPRGVCPAGEITPAAVRFYRTISPLPNRLLRCGPAVYFLWHFP